LLAAFPGKFVSGGASIGVGHVKTIGERA